MLKAAFPGSFDPPTLGHLDIIVRAAGIFEELLVVVAENRQKKYLFSAEERADMIRRLAGGCRNVAVTVCDTLIVDFMQKQGIKLLVRGVRGMEDFSYEFELSMMNKALDPGIETIFMTTDPDYFVLRSSSIKEVASFQGNVSGMVPPLVAEALKEKYRKINNGS
ncbi:MAG: pantetheine-phosphate adenylyltransferase [Treponema sp.]|jgi:pantetheine-phosphate adenylyltransferase|nr:pantetheine-phosphate adenylyltransferase [Treponema sp.]